MSNHHKKPQCTRINNQLAQEYFARVLPPDRHYELSLHLINCEDCFLVVQKWGRWTGNGAVPTQGKTLLEYRPGDGTISDNDGTIVSLRELFSRLFQEASINEQADNPATNEPSINKQLIDDGALNERSADEPAVNERSANELLINEPPINELPISAPVKMAAINELSVDRIGAANDMRDFVRQKQQLLWQLGHQRAELQKILEKTLAELARVNAATRCPRHQAMVALLKGELFGAAWQDLDTHLADCPQCQQHCLTLLDIYSLQKRQDLTRLTVLTALAPDSAPDFAPHQVTPAITDGKIIDALETVIEPATNLLTNDLLIQSPMDSPVNPQTKKGSVAAMATTLISDQLLNSISSGVSNELTSANTTKMRSRWRWPRRSLTVATMTLLLMGGVSYYFWQPKDSPPPPLDGLKAVTIPKNNFKRALTLELVREIEPAVAANEANKNLLAPAKLQQIEDLVKSRELDVAQSLLLPALAQARATNNKAMQVKLLYLQGRIYGERADFGRAIVTLQETIELAKSLNDVKLLLQPTFTLSTIYYVTDQNAAAVTQAANCLTFAQQCRDLLYQAASLQMLAISQFIASKPSQSEEMLKQSLQLALVCKNSDYILQGYTYLGVIKTERKQYLEAAQWFGKALDFAKKEASLEKQAYLAFTVEGYYARSQALAGNVSSATRLYQQAIEHANKAKVVQHLALSQLYQGLGACYVQQKQQLNAERAFAKAEVLEEEAYKRCEINNTTMSFAIERQAARRCN